MSDYEPTGLWAISDWEPAGLEARENADGLAYEEWRDRIRADDDEHDDDDERGDENDADDDA